MTEPVSHVQAVTRLVTQNREAAAFVFGYLLSDLPDERLCQSLAAWKRHLEDLAQLQAVQPESEVVAHEVAER